MQQMAEKLGPAAIVAGAKLATAAPAQGNPEAQTA